MSRRRAGTYASPLALVQATLQPQPPAPWSSQTTWGSGFMVAPPAALLQLRLYLQARLSHRRSQSMLQPPGEPGWRVAAEEAGTASQPSHVPPPRVTRSPAGVFLPVPQVAVCGPSKSGRRRAHTGSPRSLCGATPAARALRPLPRGRPYSP